MNVIYSVSQKILDAWLSFTDTIKKMFAKLRTFIKKKKKVWISQKWLADQYGVSLSTAHRAIKTLKNAGFIIVMNRGANKTNLYELNPMVANIDFWDERIWDKEPDDVPVDVPVDVRNKKEEFFYTYRNDNARENVDNRKEEIVMTSKEKKEVRERFSNLYLYDEKNQSFGGKVDPHALEKMMKYNTFEKMMGVADAYTFEYQRKIRDRGQMIRNGEAWIQAMLKDDKWKSIVNTEKNRQKAFSGIRKFGGWVRFVGSYVVEFLNGSRIELDTKPEIFESHFEHNKRMNTGVYC